MGWLLAIGLFGGALGGWLLAFLRPFIEFCSLLTTVGEWLLMEDFDGPFG